MSSINGGSVVDALVSACDRLGVRDLGMLDRGRLRATARLIACDADVVRSKVTVNGRTLWLDVRRHPSPAQRLAVIERDRTCRFTLPDGVPYERAWQWADVHRPRPPPLPTRPD